jgi:hypothetical protein
MINAKDCIDSKDLDIKSINIARWPSGGKYDEVVT